MELVAGATGALGTEICRLLRESGRDVRALVRPASDPGKVERLRALGVEVVRGDLTDRQSLDPAVAGAERVLSTATAIATGGSLAENDVQGNANLIDAAREADVGRFLFVSFLELPVRSPLEEAKREVERRLEGAVPYTVLRPSVFMELWLSPRSGWDLENDRVSVLGAVEQKRNWVSLRDVARLAVACLDDPRADEAVLTFSGDFTSPAEIIAAVEEETGRRVEVTSVPIEQLQAELEAAGDDPAARTLPALRLGFALGEPGDLSPTLREFVPDPLSARAFAVAQAQRGC